jgi:formylglycine-generating enzyme required for sulfatase activity
MKTYAFVSVAAAMLFVSALREAQAGEVSPFVYETPREFFASADFNADGKRDVVIVDKETGKFRLGYQIPEGLFNWVDCRMSGIKGVTGFSIGPVLAAKVPGLVFASADASQLSLVDVSSPVAPGKPLSIQFTAALGPSTVVAVNVGGGGNTPLADLYVGSIYNAPDANLLTLLRNDGKEFPKIADFPLAGPVVHGNRLALKGGGRELVCSIVSEEKGDTFRAEDLSTGKPVAVATVPELPAGSEYASGDFRGQPLVEFLFYKPGQNTIGYSTVTEAGDKFTLAKPETFDLGQPVRRVVTLDQTSGQKLLAIFGEGEKATLYKFDGAKAPTAILNLQATNDLFTCAAPVGDGFVIFSQASGGKFSTKYQIYNASGDTYLAGRYGGLASLADNDNITIPDIHSRIVAKQNVKTEEEMKLYTNTIPGTHVAFVMVPVKGGDFVMGSPDSEPSRKPDEGPQHNVKISPFWMAQCEVTWNEYELFMYPDEEKRTRASIATDASGDKLADAVTHPSKPYVEMSFGMGKDGFPAISMTQHAANKYCQWLSAKTGEFYRLPTEAEWEYAARAGTTSPYFFGADAAQLSQYAWFEQNSDFKYQKVGKKKPNPWGLYDIYGNVVEWVLDQYDPEYYKQCDAKGVVVDPWNKATKPYPHAVRGGSWDDEASVCRSAARRGSERAWKMQDPQLPKSIWYFSDAQFVGFRVVRPLKVPPPEEMQKYWSSGVERD